MVWDLLGVLISKIVGHLWVFLKLFYNATKNFSSSLYVTANTFFDEIFVIQENISHLSKSQNHLLKNMATKIKSKFDKYWGK